ncbi:metallophosphoesterase [Haloarcula sp. JP-L23]|uniref:metallophosphoesterase n=1 Tax=Haloarcula sp. JP-L23 TaxID=2716717 RepID=UPI00140F0A9F|nr:metallophosphoesterase [Haloarcula sp. JP-L23]
MLTIVSDTHGTDGHRLEGRTLEAVRAADHVVHAGDFTTEAVLDAVETDASTLTAVYGNNDTMGVRDRLSDVATLSWAGLTVLVVHGHEHSETALGMLARQEDADVVVVGHSHRPEIGELGGRLLVNPGSYADPRRYRPAHAELVADDGRVRVRLRSPDGAVFSTAARER